MTQPGKVFLVGAGPGDPELLSIKAFNLLQQAEVVVYDRLVAAEIMELIPQGVTRISVGKKQGNHCVPQSEINQLLVNLALAGRSVVRLKGGDPFIFGRGSEEALELRRHAIPCEVVPGITAAAAASAYAGIPLTHRGLSRSVCMVTGHLREDQPLQLDWAGLIDAETTLVIYMGLSNLPQIVEQLMAAGRAADTPAAAVQEGSTPRQRQVLATLAQLPTEVDKAGLQAPVAVIIGDCVTLAEELAWFQPPTEEIDHAKRFAGL
ncbi:MAG: uroporphyrinogen-III C-methyltransferase [Gammaproteobacteria bacterium]|nr:uroporphyrinogen-III C-methyltransferase [Gammaproteobacteria bacterium]